MITNLTLKDLIEFEEEVSDLFTQKKIRAPIHLDRNNEEYLLETFKYIKEEDWVMGSWRNQLKAYLKGVPKELLKQKILDGKSIGLQFPEYRVISSAIVGGILPIALGLAYSIKYSGQTNRVFCFLGDATSLTGTFLECYQYSIAWDLPITWILENNHKSVCTPTKSTMNREWPAIFDELIDDKTLYIDSLYHKLIYYKYEMTHPHAGSLSGERVQF